MKFKGLALLATAVGAGMLLYGVFVEAERLVLRRQLLRLKRWPKKLSGYRIGLIADFHIRDKHTVGLTKRALAALVKENPSVIVIAGDFVGYWKTESPRLLGDALEPLRDYAGVVIAVPGNHDYWSGDASFLEPICEEAGIILLRNEAFLIDGIRWLGVDSLNAKRADTTLAIWDLASQVQSASQSKGKKTSKKKAIEETEIEPTICIWHEPDAVRYLPDICDLMLSGHSHGGQFVFPGGFIPMTTRNGGKYIGGFYPNAPTPLFVTRGIGTTGPPSRFLCPPEIVLLTLI